jgi:hypothetical protein
VFWKKKVEPDRGRRIYVPKKRMEKKKAGPNPGRIIYIPGEHVEKLADLVDMSWGGGHLSNYRLWKLIEEIVPETKEGDWTLYVDDPTRYFVKEGLDE